MNLNNLNDKKEVKKKGVYFVCFVVSFLVCFLLNTFVFHIEIVNGVSMNPTLNNKDVGISIKSHLVHVKRGDIVNIDSSAANENIIKRIIGISGDSVKVVDGVLYVNNEKVEEPYILSVDDFKNDNFEIVVPDGYVFVMGDNRGNSLDSRRLGVIAIEEVKSKLLFTLGSTK